MVEPFVTDAPPRLACPTLFECQFSSCPTEAVCDSYLAGEREILAEDGGSFAWLETAAADFPAFVQIPGLREMWEVPTTELWFVEGAEYLGTVILPPLTCPDTGSMSPTSRGVEVKLAKKP